MTEEEKKDRKAILTENGSYGYCIVGVTNENNIS